MSNKYVMTLKDRSDLNRERCPRWRFTGAEHFSRIANLSLNLNAGQVVIGSIAVLFISPAQYLSLLLSILVLPAKVASGRGTYTSLSSMMVLLHCLCLSWKASIKKRSSPQIEVLWPLERLHPSHWHDERSTTNVLLGLPVIEPSMNSSVPSIQIPDTPHSLKATSFRETVPLVIGTSDRRSDLSVHRLGFPSLHVFLDLFILSL